MAQRGPVLPKSVHTDAYASLVGVLVSRRKQLRVTQAELGRRLGKPQPFISEIETRERRLDVIEFYAVARALGVDPRELFAEVVAVLPANVSI